MSLFILQTMNNKKYVIIYFLLFILVLLSTIYYLLSTIYYLLSTIYYLLSTIYYLLSTYLLKSRVILVVFAKFGLLDIRHIVIYLQAVCAAHVASLCVFQSCQQLL